MFKNLLSVTVLSIFIMSFVFQSDVFAVAPKKNPSPSDFHTGISWEEARQNEKSTIINFYVDWCSACKKFAPVFDNYRKQLKSEYNFVTIKADCPLNRKIVNNFDIPGYPTVYFIDKKQDKKQMVDFKNYFDTLKFKKEIEKFFQK